MKLNYGVEIKRCTKCSDVLNKNNSYKSNTKVKYYICKKCFALESKIYHRNRIVHSSRNGKLIYLNGPKRYYPINEKCELCYKVWKHLEYHHWDDSDISKGIWLCNWCHIFSEYMDKLFAERYLKLKRRIYETQV